MKNIPLNCLVLFLCAVLLVSGTAECGVTTVQPTGHDQSVPETEPIPVPSVYAPETEYRFGSVVEGGNIIHDFKIQNKGDGLLRIHEVKNSCKCTVAYFSRQIPPGGEGTVTLKINTLDSGSGRFSRSATVITNDKKNPRVTLRITGNVVPVATINPKIITLKGRANEKITASVNIIPNNNHPFDIVNARAKNNNITCRLDRDRTSKKTAYRLVVENQKKAPGRYTDAVSLKTTSAIKPEIVIKVYGDITDVNNI